MSKKRDRQPDLPDALCAARSPSGDRILPATGLAGPALAGARLLSRRKSFRLAAHHPAAPDPAHAPEPGRHAAPGHLSNQASVAYRLSLFHGRREWPTSITIWYYVFDGELYLPGHDPRESWELGNLYRLAIGKKWHKLRTIPHAIHTYALAFDKGILYAGLGSTTRQGKPISSVAASTDTGLSWHWSPLSGRRIHAFLHVAGRLYATDVYPPQPKKRITTYEIRGPETTWTGLLFFRARLSNRE